MGGHSGGSKAAEPTGIKDTTTVSEAGKAAQAEYMNSQKSQVAQDEQSSTTGTVAASSGQQQDRQKQPSAGTAAMRAAGGKLQSSAVVTG